MQYACAHPLTGIFFFSDLTPVELLCHLAVSVFPLRLSKQTKYSEVFQVFPFTATFFSPFKNHLFQTFLVQKHIYLYILKKKTYFYEFFIFRIQSKLLRIEKNCVLQRCIKFIFFPRFFPFFDFLP